ncbi:hypothetical protein BDZ89DRAFT_1056501 [Hymenopellis radicata]|nr:hypothetical protein BDZ89DRAFT_1056501 [Hymenopellis radicata]
MGGKNLRSHLSAASKELRHCVPAPPSPHERKLPTPCNVWIRFKYWACPRLGA